ncbi:MAG: hypothetical protein AAGB27_06925 [Pseudomonadota bacterium]
MSLLDQLEQQARDRREQEERESQRVSEKSEFYRAHSAPAMRAIFGYLKKLSQHLEYLDHEQTVDYHIPHYGDVTARVEPEFTVALSTEKGVRSEIKIVATGHIDRAKSPDVTLNQQQTEVLDSFVRDYSLHGEKRTLKSPNGDVVGSTFRIHGKILLRGLIRTNHNEEHIELEFVNYGGLTSHRRHADPRVVNDDFLDKLGKFLIGEDLSLFAETLPSGVRNRIRETVQRDQEAKRLEMLESEIADLEDEEEKSSTLSGRLSQRLSALSRKLKGEG